MIATKRRANYEPKKRKKVIFRAPITIDGEGKRSISFPYTEESENEIRERLSRIVNIIGFSEREEWVDE